MNYKKSTKSIFAYSTLGIQLAFFMVISVYAGYRLDLYFDSSPWFVVIGAFLGLGGGLYNLIRSLYQMDKISKDKEPKEQDKNKWM